MDPETRRLLRIALGAGLAIVGLLILVGAIAMAAPASYIVGGILLVVGLIVLIGAL